VLSLSTRTVGAVTFLSWGFQRYTHTNTIGEETGVSNTYTDTYTIGEKTTYTDTHTNIYMLSGGGDHVTETGHVREYIYMYVCIYIYTYMYIPQPRSMYLHVCI
jgi:hypothetical protein